MYFIYIHFYISCFTAKEWRCSWEDEMGNLVCLEKKLAREFLIDNLVMGQPASYKSPSKY